VHYYTNAHMQSSQLSFSVSPSSGVPIYRQIIDQVHALVLSGRLRPGDHLPSIRNLAETLEVNMMTISKAYARLEVEGILVRLRGVGMVVAEPSTTTSASVKERQSELRPLMEQAVLRGLQLKLTNPQIIAVVESILKENCNE
jgi:GntR family transcriptional regulator